MAGFKSVPGRSSIFHFHDYGRKGAHFFFRLSVQLFVRSMNFLSGKKKHICPKTGLFLCVFFS